MFDYPFGPIDPRLLPAQLSQLAAPGQFPGPVPALQLVTGFRPPGVSLGGLQATQPVPGFNVKDGFAAFTEALAEIGKKQKNATGTTEPVVPRTPAGIPLMEWLPRTRLLGPI